MSCSLIGHHGDTPAHSSAISHGVTHRMTHPWGAGEGAQGKWREQSTVRPGARPPPSPCGTKTFCQVVGGLVVGYNPIQHTQGHTNTTPH